MKTKLKIAYLDYSHIFAGAERVLHTIIANLNRDEFEPILVFPYPMPHHKNYDDLNCKKFYISNGLKWWMGSDRWKKPLRGTDFLMRTIMGIKLSFLLKKEQVDILHVNLLRPDSLMWMLPSHLLGVKIIGHFRSQKYEWIAPTLAQKCCNLILCVSKYSKQRMLLKGEHAKTHVLYDSIDIVNFKTDISKLEAKRNLHFPEDCFLISSIGQLSRHKGHDNAIKAFSEISKYKQNAILYIAGGGSNDDLNYLKNIVRNLHLEDKVKFSEKQLSNIKEVYRASDLVLSLTKVGEAFGLVPYEATLLGTPFIAPDKGAVKEFIINKENGILVNTNEIEDIVEAIKFVIDNPLKMEEMNKKAYQVIEEKLTPTIMVENLENEYKVLFK